MATAALEASDEARVTVSPDRELHPSLGVDSDGNLHVLYYNITDGAGSALEYRKVSPSGVTLSGPMGVTREAFEVHYGADIAVDHLDRVHIVHSVLYEGDLCSDVRYLQLTREGTVAVGERRVFESPHESFDPQVDTDDAGNVYVLLLDMGVSEVRWTRVAPSGVVVGECIVVSDTQGAPQMSHPRFAVSGEGASFITWYQKDSRFSPWGMVYASLSPEGEVLVEPTYVSRDVRIEARCMDVDIDGDDHLHVVDLAEDPLMVDTVGVYYTQVDPSGDAVVEREVVEREPRTWCDGCDVIVSEAGEARIVYTRGGGRANPWTDMVLRSRPAGQGGFGEATVLSTGQCSSPSIHSQDFQYFGLAYTREDDLWVLGLSEGPVNRPPTAHLTCSHTAPQVGQTVTFDGGESQDPDPGDEVSLFYFDWGDGTTSGWTSSPTASYAYSSPGTYTASLRVQDTQGAECEAPSTLAITVSEGRPNQPPVPVLEARPTSVAPGETVTLDGSDSYDTDGRVEAYRFDFGDGGDSGWTTSAVAVHSYDREGTFEATLRVRDREGAVSEATARAAVSVDAPNEPPTASILAISPSPATEGEEVGFEGEGRDLDGSVAHMRWTSDRDGLLSEEASFSSHGLSVGTHVISFSVLDDEGAWSEADTWVLEVRENAPPSVMVLTTVGDCLTGERVDLLVRYTDPEGDLPTLALIYYGSSGHLDHKGLRQVDGSDANCRDGKDYHLLVQFEKAGRGQFFFVFENARNGRVTSEVVEFQVRDPEDDATASGQLWPGLMLLVLGTVAALVVAERAWRRERPPT